MMASDYVRELIAYNYDQHERVWASIMQLSEAQFVAKAPYSVGSIRNHIVHLASVDRSWLADIRGERAHYSNPVHFPTRAAARALWEPVAQAVQSFAATLDDAALDEAPPRLRGVTVGRALLHLVNHGTDHRAQLLRLLHEAGAPTFAQDYALYLKGRL